MAEPNDQDHAEADPFLAGYQAGVAAERERCAAICDEYAHTHTTTRKGEGAEICAARIRNLLE